MTIVTVVSIQYETTSVGSEVTSTYMRQHSFNYNMQANF